MAREFILPDIGEGLTEAEVVKWLVPVGEQVKVDQPVVELETDKAVVEIPSPFGGIVLHHGAAAGETIAVGSILVVIGEEGESWAGPNVKPIVGTLSEEAEVLPQRSVVTAAGRRKVQALPLVRKLAKEMGVDLESLKGTGSDGRITREDVVAAAASPPATVEEGSDGEVDEAASTVASGEDERRALTKLRRTIADNMSRAWSEIPHVTTFDAVDGTRLLAARRSLENRHGSKVPLESLVIKAVIPALAQHREFNATLDGDHLLLHGSYNIGVAVDTPEGLMVAVIRNAGDMRLLELAGEVTRLAEGAKSRKLKPAELSGQSFTVSNIGAVGGGYGTPIIPPGTTAILSVGKAEEKPVARQGRVEIAPMIPLSLSYDHRVIDGAMGRRFMAMLLENLEEPALFLA